MDVSERLRAHCAFMREWMSQVDDPITRLRDAVINEGAVQSISDAPAKFAPVIVDASSDAFEAAEVQLNQFLASLQKLDRLGKLQRETPPKFSEGESSSAVTSAATTTTASTAATPTFRLTDKCPDSALDRCSDEALCSDRGRGARVRPPEKDTLASVSTSAGKKPFSSGRLTALAKEFTTACTQAENRILDADKEALKGLIWPPTLHSVCISPQRSQSQLRLPQNYWRWEALLDQIPAHCKAGDVQREKSTYHHSRSNGMNLLTHDCSHCMPRTLMPLPKLLPDDEGGLKPCDLQGQGDDLPVLLGGKASSLASYERLNLTHTNIASCRHQVSPKECDELTRDCLAEATSVGRNRLSPQNYISDVCYDLRQMRLQLKEGIRNNGTPDWAYDTFVDIPSARHSHNVGSAL